MDLKKFYELFVLFLRYISGNWYHLQTPTESLCCCCGYKPLTGRSLNDFWYLFGLPVSLFFSYNFCLSAEPWKDRGRGPTLLVESSWKPSIRSCL